MRSAVILACLAAVACGESEAPPPAVPAVASVSVRETDGPSRRPDWVGLPSPPVPAPAPAPIVTVSAPSEVSTQACEKGTLADCVAACAQSGDACALLGKRICREGSVAECTASCDGGNAEACFALAGITAAGARVPANADRARVLLQRACDGGHAHACWHLGVGRLYGTFRAHAGDGDAIEAFERACDLSGARSRDDYAADAWKVLLDHQFDPETKMSADDALKYGAADDIGGPSCNVFEHLAPARAARLYEKHCATPATTEAARVPAACDGLVDLAPERALPLVASRCGNGDAAACALVIRIGDKKAKLVDAPLAITALRKLCDTAAAKNATASVDYCGRLKDLGASP